LDEQIAGLLLVVSGDARYARDARESLDCDQELIALGAASITSAFFGGFAQARALAFHVHAVFVFVFVFVFVSDISL
jgi:hypothetical protein